MNRFAVADASRAERDAVVSYLLEAAAVFVVASCAEEIEIPEANKLQAQAVALTTAANRIRKGSHLIDGGK